MRRFVELEQRYANLRQELDVECAKNKLLSALVKYINEPPPIGVEDMLKSIALDTRLYYWKRSA